MQLVRRRWTRTARHRTTTNDRPERINRQTGRVRLRAVRRRLVQIIASRTKTTRNRTKRKTKRNETKRNETKRNETKRDDHVEVNEERGASGEWGCAKSLLRNYPTIGEKKRCLLDRRRNNPTGNHPSNRDKSLAEKRSAGMERVDSRDGLTPQAAEQH
jgi:hypothetical protein